MTISERWRGLLVLLLTVAMAVVAWRVLPHQDLAGYGHFADDAGPGFNTLNVVSNAGFLIAGLVGLWRLPRKNAAAMALFGGVVATAFGSAYFHVRPLIGEELNRFTLLWDRLPMTVAFAGLLALVLHDRGVESRLALPLLTAAGVGTVLWWYWSRDLFPYGFFQLYAAAGTLLMITILRPRFTEAGYVVAGVVLFGVAKLFEDLDHEIFRKWPVGGHPLKHVAGALAALMILLWLTKRKQTTA